MKNIPLLLASAAVLLGCAPKDQSLIATHSPLSVAMCRSEMARYPQAVKLDHLSSPRWTYTLGLETRAMVDVAERYDCPDILSYAMAYPDTMVTAEGDILTYNIAKYNLDMICSGRMLFEALDRTGEERYRRAAALLYRQLKEQPRTKEGGFWHKQIYTQQMWLDGLFMAEPFYAEYVGRFGGEGNEESIDRDSCYQDIVRQFVVVADNTYDPATHLYRHAWDSTHQMFWCDPETGQSPHAWGRAMGWYAMAIVETLDYLPVETVGRDQLIQILRGIYAELPRYADPETGMWYQVLDSPTREGNYQESTCSAMFTYAALKGVRMGYLDSSLGDWSRKCYEQFVDRFMRLDPDGTITMTDCCAVAGLGGDSKRSGTFDYYISEPIVENDPKGVGAFILASLEYENCNRH